MIKDNDLAELNKLKKDIIIKYDRKEISEKEYNKVMKEITRLSNERLAEILPAPITEVKTMEEKVKAVKAEKPKKEKVISRQSVILDVLAMKTMTTVEKVVAKIIERRPQDAQKAKDVKVHVKWTINKIKNKNPRFINAETNIE